ncbi:MAG TPA: CsbD family protein [Pyrinomonadaceae bacterium]|nr:CsbD family protein [Pyrinomonadaceae bacterium]
MGNNDSGDLNRDQVAGRTDQAAGEVKETVGEATGDKQLEREGVGEQVAGQARERDGDRKEEIGDALNKGDVDTLRDAILDDKK